MTHGDLGLDGAVCGFLPNNAWFPPFADGFFFFFSVTWLLASPSEEEEGEGEMNEVEGWGVTLISFGC